MLSSFVERERQVPASFERERETWMQGSFVRDTERELLRSFEREREMVREMRERDARLL
ncbi:Vacuolar Protein Sorting-Associated Protein 13C, partial [Manis pentadactyla]